MQKYLNVKWCLNRLIFLLILLTSKGYAEMSEGGKAFYRFSKEFSLEVQKEYGFSPYSQGVSFPVKIESIDLCFSINKSQEIEEARRLVIPIALKMLERINQCDYLQPYLSEHPFPLEKIMVGLCFDKATGKPNRLRSTTFHGSRNIIFYDTMDEKTYKQIEIHRETFDEAIKILQDESSKCM